MLRDCLARELSTIRTFPGPTLTRKRGITTFGEGTRRTSCERPAADYAAADPSYDRVGHR